MRVGNELRFVVSVVPAVRCRRESETTAPRGNVRVVGLYYRWKTPAPPIRTSATVTGSAISSGWSSLAETAAKEQVTQVQPASAEVGKIGVSELLLYGDDPIAMTDSPLASGVYAAGE